jgi:hypothetical protein
MNGLQRPMLLKIRRKILKLQIPVWLNDTIHGHAPLKDTQLFRGVPARVWNTPSR